MTIPTAEQLIAQYALTPHPEGGYYKEFYRSNLALSSNALPPHFGGERNICTAIYFLLQKAIFLHFIASKAMRFGIFMRAEPYYYTFCTPTDNCTPCI